MSDFSDYKINKSTFLDGLQPPPRYKECRFSNYFPDEHFPSQKNTVRLLTTTVSRLNSFIKSNFISKHFLRKKSTIRGLYLDGGFGIGKTHLLTSVFHEFNGTKIYMSFSELMYIISYFGMDDMISRLKHIQLICIDEFELDDVGNTMKASNFITQIVAQDTFIVTTSNTVAGELGKGRFNANDFEREIGRISSIFKKVTIDGKDFRQSGSNEDDYQLFHYNEDNTSSVSFDKLNKLLYELPQLFYADYAKTHLNWVLSEMKEFVIQDNALRFTHFIDKVYDSNISLKLSFKSDDYRLFPDEYLNGSYQKKYKRCLSRLHELTKP